MIATTATGEAVAAALGLTIIGNEGHDLKCGCPFCDSSDAGRVHEDTGAYYCFSCQKALSAWDHLKLRLGKDEAKRIMIEMGIFQDFGSSKNGYSPPAVKHQVNGKHNNAEAAFLEVCRLKRMPEKAARVYGGEAEKGGIVFPMWGPDLERCSAMLITPSNGKGLNAKKNPTGLFLPGRSPDPGESWLIVEGVKDATALYELGHLVAGLPSNRLGGKCVPMFKGAHVTVLTDGDKAGKEGGAVTAKLLQGVAGSVKISSFPDGKDARDVLASEGVCGIGRVLGNAIPAGEGNSRPLPTIRDAFDLCLHDIPLPPELIEGILHKGSKLSFGGSSKGFKTWTLDWLALAVAYGQPWLGCKTIKSKVLLIDMELQDAFCRQRLKTLQESLQIKPEKGLLDVWNLRGFTTSHSEIFPKIIERIGNGGYGLVVLDPIYKLYGDQTDENSAKDVAALMNSIESLTVETGAAVAFGSHFSKGNQAGKSAIDRVSGSGVFSRDPDSLINLTAHAEPDCYTLEATLRNFKPLDPFVVRWSFPLFDRRNDLDPTALKKPAGRPTVYTADEVLAALDGSMNSTSWKKATGIKKYEVFSALRDELLSSGRVKQNGQKWEIFT